MSELILHFVFCTYLLIYVISDDDDEKSKHVEGVIVKLHFFLRFDTHKVHSPTNALFINLDKVLKFYIKNHFGLFLHVSVCDHHRGAFIRA